MLKLRIISLITSLISIIGFIMWRFITPFPDWSIRVFGVTMLVSIVLMVFSSVKIAQTKKSSLTNNK